MSYQKWEQSFLLHLSVAGCLNQLGILKPLNFFTRFGITMLLLNALFSLVCLRNKMTKLACFDDVLSVFISRFSLCWFPCQLKCKRDLMASLYSYLLQSRKFIVKKIWESTDDRREFFIIFFLYSSWYCLSSNVVPFSFFPMNPVLYIP